MRSLARLLAPLAGLFLAGAAAAQEDAAAEFSTLLADRVEMTADGRLVASGNVEAMQGDVRLKARRVVYDKDADRLEIEGPITLSQGDQTVVLASAAALSPDLRDGVIRSARVFMDQQLQLAANEINRREGRYTLLYNTVASSCQVCAAHPVPLWQIRAREVVHDDVERQLYFDHARFEVMGVPVMYLPKLRLPDPTVKRATGFLTPRLRSTDELGFGIKLPYFITLGQSRDVTLTPYVSTNWTRTLELRYRQAFRTGAIEVNGAVSRDDLHDGPRAYLFAEGAFGLPRDYLLDFQIQTVSDDTYLLDYDYSDADRLESGISITRARRDEFFVGELISYESLRASESNQTQPFLVGDVNWTNRFEPGWLGGIATVSLDAHMHQRRSTEDVVGRDVSRLSGWMGWHRNAVGPWGLMFAAEALARIDHTLVNDDSNYPDPITQITPFGVAELRWPLVRPSGRGGEMLEPILQIVYSPDAPQETPQDESTQLEFDEGNLFALSRFPAADVLERGLRANVGLGWTRYDPAGWSLGLTGGRIFRAEDLGQFAGYNSFEGQDSDWLTAISIHLPNRLSLINRAVFDDEFSFAKNELRFDWNSDFLEMGSSFIWLEPSPVEDRPETTRQLALDGEWQINRRWQTAFDWRYDMELDRSALAQLGIEYRTDCATFDFSVRRRFTSTDQLRPTTDYNFEIQLAGFGAPSNGRPRPTRPGCRG